MYYIYYMKNGKVCYIANGKTFYSPREAALYMRLHLTEWYRRRCLIAEV